MGWKKTKKNSSDEVSLLYVFTHRGRHLQDSKKVTANVDQIVTSPPTHFLFCRLFQKNTANITLERINSWVGIYLKKKKKKLFANTLRVTRCFTFFLRTRGGIFSVVGARVNVRVRQRLFESLVGQEIGFFDTTKTGELTSRLAADCTKVGDQVTLNVNVFLRWVV